MTPRIKESEFFNFIKSGRNTASQQAIAEDTYFKWFSVQMEALLQYGINLNDRELILTNTIDPNHYSNFAWFNAGMSLLESQNNHKIVHPIY
jgi:hypothetical protein